MDASRRTKQSKGRGEKKQGSHMTSSHHQTMHMTLQHPARQYTLIHTRTQSKSCN